MTRTATSGRTRERGAASVELALLILPLLGVLLLAVPLPFAMLDRIRLERAAGQAARFATMEPDRAHPGVAAGHRRPTEAEIIDEARRAYSGVGSVPDVTVTVEPAGRCPLRRATSVELTTQVDLGPFAFAYQALHLAPQGAVSLTATATNCQE